MDSAARRKEAAMEVLYGRCCGLDVHKETVAACVLIRDAGRVQKEKRIFGTTTRELLELADWLASRSVTHVAMESTSVYWKPVWNILEGLVDITLVNPQHFKSVPGRKTDLKDGEWLGDLLQHGLLRKSFVPPRPIRDLRDLTRCRAMLAREKARLSSRIQKVLEDANIKLASVASDVLGASGRDMLNAIVRGECDAHVLAELARKRLRAKIPELQAALAGSITDHHRFLLRQWLEMLSVVEGKIAEFDVRIDELMRPFAPAVEIWMGIPGIDRIAAWSLVAEIGVDMNQFPSADHLSSWAGVCPGSNESAGKRKSGKTRRGSVWLRRVLCESAWAASHCKKSYFQAQFHRLAGKRGKKRALIAVAHSLLTVAYVLLKRGCAYQDLGRDYFERTNHSSVTRYHVKKLQRLGFTVTLQQEQPA
jgi:transposase